MEQQVFQFIILGAVFGLWADVCSLRAQKFYSVMFNIVAAMCLIAAAFEEFTS